MIWDWVIPAVLAVAFLILWLWVLPRFGVGT
jgi:hypothetical protein